MLNYKAYCEQCGEVATVDSIRGALVEVTHEPEGTYAGTHAHGTYAHDHADSTGYVQRDTKTGEIATGHLDQRYYRNVADVHEPEHRHTILLSDGTRLPA